MKKMVEQICNFRNIVKEGFACFVSNPFPRIPQQIHTFIQVTFHFIFIAHVMTTHHLQLSQVKTKTKFQSSFIFFYHNRFMYRIFDQTDDHVHLLYGIFPIHFAITPHHTTTGLLILPLPPHCTLQLWNTARYGGYTVHSIISIFGFLFFLHNSNITMHHPKRQSIK